MRVASLPNSVCQRRRLPVQQARKCLTGNPGNGYTETQLRFLNCCWHQLDEGAQTSLVAASCRSAAFQQCLAAAAVNGTPDRPNSELLKAQWLWRVTAWRCSALAQHKTTPTNQGAGRPHTSDSRTTHKHSIQAQCRGSAQVPAPLSSHISHGCIVQHTASRSGMRACWHGVLRSRAAPHHSMSDPVILLSLMNHHIVSLKLWTVRQPTPPHV